MTPTATGRRLYHPSGACTLKASRYAGKPVTIAAWQIGKPILLGKMPNGDLYFGYRWWGKVKEFDAFIPEYELLELKESHQ